MEIDILFRYANLTALAGWIVLIVSPIAPKWADIISGIVIPLVLSVGYTGLILVYWADADGGFGELADVMALFTQPEVAFAGWLHYLAFDLFVGAWETRIGREERIPHLLVIPCLLLTFMFGPIGFVAFLALRMIPFGARSVQTA